MPFLTIPQLPSGVTPSGIEPFESVQNGSSVQFSLSQLASFIGNQGNANSNPASLTPSATGSSILARGASNTIQYINMGVGSGAYTYTLTLGTIGAGRGDRMDIKVALPSSTNPTLAIVGNATENIISTGFVFSSYLVYIYNGTVWELYFRSA